MVASDLILARHSDSDEQKRRRQRAPYLRQRIQEDEPLLSLLSCLFQSSGDHLPRCLGLPRNQLGPWFKIWVESGFDHASTEATEFCSAHYSRRSLQRLHAWRESGRSIPRCCVDPHLRLNEMGPLLLWLGQLDLLEVFYPDLYSALPTCLSPGVSCGEWSIDALRFFIALFLDSAGRLSLEDVDSLLAFDGVWRIERIRFLINLGQIRCALEEPELSTLPLHARRIPHSLIWAYYQLGVAYKEQGELDLALSIFDRLKQSTCKGQSIQGSLDGQLAEVGWRRSRLLSGPAAERALDESHSYALSAYQCFSRSPFSYRRAFVLTTLARIHCDRGESAEATLAYRQALGCFVEFGLHRYADVVLRELNECSHTSSQLDSERQQ